MKSTSILSIALLSALTSGAFAQGSLTPPAGPPAPVFKTLDQVEARIPLVAGQPGVAINAAGTITISQPGSYYLTGNRTYTTAGTNGIVIGSSHVTLDLNGFVLSCTTVDGGSAISIAGSSSVTVKNGQIRGGTTVSGVTFTPAGWQHGLNATTSVLTNLCATDLLVQGVREKGINLGLYGSRVESCSVSICGQEGIIGTSISSSSARQTARDAILAEGTEIEATVAHSFGESLGAETFYGGIDCAGMVAHSTGKARGGDGINAETVSDSTGYSVTGTGIRGKVVSNSRGEVNNASTGVGIAAEVANTCVAGRSGGVGTAINASIAIGCRATSGTITSAQKHLGTP